MEEFVSYGQMLLPMFYHLADVITFFNTVVVGKTLHYIFGLIIAGVIAKWQDGTATFLCFEDWQMLLPCGKMEQPHWYWTMADVIVRWQMLWLLGDGTW